MKIPSVKSRYQNLTAHYAIKMTPDMKDKIDELKKFKGVDMPELIRTMISEKINEIDDSLKRGKVVWK